MSELSAGNKLVKDGLNDGLETSGKELNVSGK